MINFSLSEIGLLEKIQRIFKYKSLFILGAGVSARHIKIEYSVHEKAKQGVFILASAPVVSDSPIYGYTNEQKTRFEITGSPHKITNVEGKCFIEGTDMDFCDSVLHNNPDFIELFCALTYTLDEYPQYCPEYQTLNSANHNSIIITLNHDQLAEKFIRNLKVIPLHGSMSPQQNKLLRPLLPYSLDFNINDDFLKHMHLATKESEKILLEREYLSFINILKNNGFQYIVTIGYSFFKKNDCDIYDVVTYDLIRSYIMEFSPQIIIIDPNPEYIADILAKRIGSL